MKSFNEFIGDRLFENRGLEASKILEGGIDAGASFWREYFGLFDNSSTEDWICSYLNCTLDEIYSADRDNWNSSGHGVFPCTFKPLPLTDENILILRGDVYYRYGTMNIDGADIKCIRESDPGSNFWAYLFNHNELLNIAEEGGAPMKPDADFLYNLGMLNREVGRDAYDLD